MGGNGLDRSSDADAGGMGRFRACLMIGVVVYLGLAWLSTRWLPDYPVIAWVLVFFGAQSAAFLFANEVRGDRSDPNEGEW